jgi:ATP-dependent Clp protease protease subunit
MNKIDHFWNWIRDADSGERVLYLDGTIASETWLDNDITPAAFKAELLSSNGDVTIWLNSGGGDIIAASQIFAMLMDYKGNVTIKIDGIAASAASVIAMAGTTVLMAPTATIMIHEPQTVAVGDSSEMLRAKAMLDEIRESIINAYQMRTNLSRTVLSHMMEAETWMNANKAIQLGFADGVLTDEKRRVIDDTPRAYSPRSVTNSLIDRMRLKPPDPQKPIGIPVESLQKRLIRYCSAPGNSV